MKSDDEETQVFIVRLWRERREIEVRRLLLRGTVELVSSGDRRSVSNLSSLTMFVLPFIDAMDPDHEGMANERSIHD